jgi:hypothetical protein
MKDRNNLIISMAVRKNSHHARMDESKNLHHIPLRNYFHPSRIKSENEWNQEYYIIYNSYILEDKDN